LAQSGGVEMSLMYSSIRNVDVLRALDEAANADGWATAEAIVGVLRERFPDERFGTSPTSSVAGRLVWARRRGEIEARYQPPGELTLYGLTDHGWALAFPDNDKDGESNGS
jgi:hypothetical protein